MNKNLTTSQKDYALFLPATSGFYSSFVGYQRKRFPYVPDNRIPSNFQNNIESLNYLNAQKGAFTYKWCLYSAGHADLDTTKIVPKEDMVRNRDRENTWLLGDSGGFQIGKGVARRLEGSKLPGCYEKTQTSIKLDGYSNGLWYVLGYSSMGCT